MAFESFWYALLGDSLGTLVCREPQQAFHQRLLCGELFAMTNSSFGASSLDDVARITAEQAAELARFVAQVSPDTLEQLLAMLAWGPFIVPAFSRQGLLDELVG